jgi:multicomponent Na+:H+ antiporter subunit G
MSLREAVAALLLGLAALALLLSLVGMMRAKDTMTRLHFLGPPAAIVPTLFAAGVLVAEGWGASFNKALLTLLILLVYSPVLTHATARMLHERDEEAA